MSTIDPVSLDVAGAMTGGLAVPETIGLAPVESRPLVREHVFDPIGRPAPDASGPSTIDMLRSALLAVEQSASAIAEKPLASERPLVAERPVVVEKQAVVADEPEPAAVVKPVVAERPIVVEKPVVAEKPVVSEKLVVVEKQAAVADEPEPVAVEKPVVAERPIVVEKPVVSEKPVISEKLVVVEKQAAVAGEAEPVAVDKSVVAERPIVVERPVVAETSVVAEKPAVVADEPDTVAVDKAVVAERSPVPEKPVAVERPVVAETPVVAEKPVVSEKPVVAEKPVVVADEPEPVVVDKPVVAERSPVSEKAVAVERPVVADKPAVVAGKSEPVVAEVRSDVRNGQVPVDEGDFAAGLDRAVSAKEGPVAAEVGRPASVGRPDVAGKVAVAAKTSAGVGNAVDGEVGRDDGPSSRIQAMPFVMPDVAGAAVAQAPSAMPESVVLDLSRTAATARTQELVEAAVSVSETILVTPSLVRGDGEMTIRLKPTVLDGSEIRLEAKGSEISISVQPATAAVAQVVERSRAQFEQALAERLPSFQVVVSVQSLRAAAGKGARRVEDKNETV